MNNLHGLAPLQVHGLIGLLSVLNGRGGPGDFPWAQCIKKKVLRGLGEYKNVEDFSKVQGGLRKFRCACGVESGANS